MPDDIPTNQTVTQNPPTDQSVVPELPKIEEKPEETIPSEASAKDGPQTETPPEEKSVPAEETKPEPVSEVPEQPQTPLPSETLAEERITPKEEAQKPTESQPATSIPSNPPKPSEITPEKITPIEKPVEKESSPIPETPKPPLPRQSSDAVGTEAGQIPQTNLDDLRAKANKARQERKTEHLSEIEKLAKSKPINNNDVRELLHISQSTATNYLEKLLKSGKIKKSGKAKATTYSS